MENRRLWVLAAEDARDARLSALERAGHTLVRHAQARPLLDLLEGGADDEPPVVLLVDQAVENCVHAGAFVDSLPAAVLIAFSQSDEEGEWQALLRSGVDWIVRPTDSAAYLAAVISALSRRRRQFTRATVDDDQRVGAWSLRHDAWYLAHDDGPRVRLSEAERILVRALFAASDHALGEDELAHAVLQAWHRRRGHERRASVNVPLMVGRLRAKGRRVDLRIPIRSVDDSRVAWGD